MSYEMSGQNMTYPYPPPAGAPVAIPPRKQFSKWWPISFFIAAIIFFIIGGGLFGGWTATYSTSFDSYYYSSSSRYRMGTGNNALFYGAVACMALGGICKLVAWILLIVFCVKRSSRQQTSVAYTYQPLTYGNVPAAPTAAATAAYPNAPPYYPTTQSPAPAHSKEQPATMRYCSQCGTGVTTPFCSRCGVAV